MSNYGKKDCGQRFPQWVGYHYCLCHYHQVRRFGRLKERIKNGVPQRVKKTK